MATTIAEQGLLVRRPGPADLTGTGRRGERRTEKLAGWTVAASGAAIAVALAGVAVFLLVRGAPALGAPAAELPYQVDFWSLAGPLVFGSVWVSGLALLFAVPVAIAVALFISRLAPRSVARYCGVAVDLLAAVPSVVYGLWGIMVLAPGLAVCYRWLSENMGWFPLFAGTPSPTGRTILTAALVLAVMIMPIMASVCREVFAQTPSSTSEAALALGATKWETIKLAVLPFGRSGILTGAMLGLGRALGETMAIAMVLSPTPLLVSLQLLNS
ncbi:MAG: phosphate ABC transporter permease subunit PstC, partial [Propionibacteriaceae bacterium]|nr:phosphate ABC transporter permease subunit PstC [Propionibacteriaceae bacterium]